MKECTSQYVNVPRAAHAVLTRHGAGYDCSVSQTADCTIPSFYWRTFLLENTMKTKSLVPAVVALALSVSALSSMAATPDELPGDSAPAAVAVDRTITITPDTMYVNVESGQIVRFDVGEQIFTLDFDGAEDVGSFDLNQVLPPGSLDHPVKVFVLPTPTYLNTI
jgi:hypothetical protein